MVGSYEEISAKQEEGTLNRTVASTNMNATSSRAHTIVGITFVQKVQRHLAHLQNIIRLKAPTSYNYTMDLILKNYTF